MISGEPLLTGGRVRAGGGRAPEVLVVVVIVVAGGSVEAGGARVPNVVVLLPLPLVGWPVA